MRGSATYQGKTVPIAELACRLGVTVRALRHRVNRRWPESRWGETVQQRTETVTAICAQCGAEVTRVNRAEVAEGQLKYCSRACFAAAHGDKVASHGHTRGGHSPTYKVWHNVQQRCENPSHKAYARYGGRGISLCERWKSFENFLADMGERPKGLTIDRINSDGNYEPGNCRWATMKEQCNNWGGARNLRVTYHGAQHTLQELSDVLAIDRYTLRRRILDMKWPEERWSDRPLARNNAQSKGRHLG